MHIIQQHLINSSHNTEIHKISAHAGILGNEQADQLAKEAAHLAATNKNDPTFIIPDQDDMLLKNIQTSNLYLKSWNDEWQKQYHDKLSFSKQIIPTISFMKSLFHQILVKLKPENFKIIQRLLSGKTLLAAHMSQITKSSKRCKHCYLDEETIEHFLLYCWNWREQREQLFEQVEQLTQVKQQEITTQMLLTGHPLTKTSTIIRLLELTCMFVRTTKRYI